MVLETRGPYAHDGLTNSTPLWTRAVPWNPVALSGNNYPPIIVAALVESMLYGVHLILFGICIFLLVNKSLRLQNLMLGGLCAMFVLSTADIALTWKFLVKEPEGMVKGTTLTFLKKLFPKFMIFVTNNLISVSLLIARCYVVWGQRKIVAIGFGTPLVIGTALGYASHVSRPDLMRLFAPIFILLTLILVNVLTLLTAGRIWWLSGGVATTLGRRQQGQYRTLSAVIVESGLVYSVSLLILIGLVSTMWSTLAGALVLRFVCIAPIMIVVQITIGQAVYSPRRAAEMTTGIHGGDDAETAMERKTRTDMIDLDTIHVHVVGPEGPGESSMQLTTHASSMGRND